MYTLVRRFRYEDSGDPMAGLRVLLNDIGPNAESTNVPLNYKLLGSNSVLRDNLVTNAQGAIAVSVEDNNGFEVVLVDVDGSVAYREKIVPGQFPNVGYVDTDNYDDFAVDDEPIAVEVQASVELVEGDDPVNVPYRILYASGRWSAVMSNMGSGLGDPGVATVDVDDVEGVLVVTPVAAGTTEFEFTGDIFGTVILAITVTEAP